MTAARLRRARCLVCYWEDGNLVAHAYPRGTPTALSAAAVDLLTAFEDWTEPEEFPRETQEVIDTLITGGVLLAEGGEPARQDAELAHHWGPWSPQAAFLHYTTQDFAQPPAGDGPVRDGGDALFTRYPDADRIPLPRPSIELESPYGRVLYGRRTHYTFTDGPVPLETLAVLLANVFGPVEYLDAGPAGAVYRRTSPNAGARQELEAYLAIRDVASVEPGWYHYNAAEHSLELLREGCLGEELTEVCAGQEWVGRAAFLLPLVSVIERQLSHHATARAYRVSLLNAGHLAQTFALTATALGLGPFQLAGRHDTAIAARLGLDNIAHTPVHLLGAGLPTETAEPGLHSDQPGVLP